MSYRYDPFGNIISQTGSFSNPYLYAGEPYDPETGNYYLQSRYYDPATGRFLTQDTLAGNPADPLNLDLYVYVDNNPMTRVDPTGHVAWWCPLLGPGTIIFFSACRPQGLSLGATLELTAISLPVVASIIETHGEDFSQVAAELSEADYAALAEDATQNVGSDVVYLGKYVGEENPASYQQIGLNKGGTYFQLKNWNEIVGKYGEKTAWKINETFLKNQLSQGKAFILTNDPETATGSFAKEVNFLREADYKFVTDGKYWRAVKA